MARRQLTPTAASRFDPPNLDGIPGELKGLRRWLVWRRSSLPDKSGRYGKLPYNVADKKAAWNNPAEWRIFPEAVQQFQRGNYDGVGIVLGDGLCGLDEDDCLSGPELQPEARGHIEHLNSYSEISPSGSGVKCIAFGSLPAGGRKTGKHELYDGARFWTVTGWHLPGTPCRVERRGRELHELHAMIFGTTQTAEVAEAVLEHPSTVPKPVPNTQREGGRGTRISSSSFSVSNQQVIDWIRRDPFAGPLWERGHTPGGDESKEDFAFACKLAFRTRKNIDQASELFRASPLARRPKALREDYITRTLRSAFEEHPHEWEPKHRERSSKGKGGRPRSKADPEEIARLRLEGMPFRQIGKTLGISPSDAYRKLQQSDALQNPNPRAAKAFQNSAEGHGKGEVPALVCEAPQGAIDPEPDEGDDCPRCGRVMGPQPTAGICKRCYWQQAQEKHRFAGNRAAVVKRDGGACRVCKETRRSRLIVHHREHGQNHMENLITLCRKCHGKVHHLEALYTYEDPLLWELWAEQHPKHWKQEQFLLAS